MGSEVRKTTADAAQDPNAVAIGLVERNEQAAEIKKYLDQMLANARNNKNQGSNTIIQSTSNADELKKYKELLDSGIISQEEFDAKKKQLLGL
ncbi:MAG: SHOCT domain-containing protein [Clostridia bacterium]|nr:SHOCT domain-containing protein [Clostridia bacterium]